jgi:hypothetical protein
VELLGKFTLWRKTVACFVDVLANETTDFDNHRLRNPRTTHWFDHVRFPFQWLAMKLEDHRRCPA